MWLTTLCMCHTVLPLINGCKQWCWQQLIQISCKNIDLSLHFWYFWKTTDIQYKHWLKWTGAGFWQKMNMLLTRLITNWSFLKKSQKIYLFNWSNWRQLKRFFYFIWFSCENWPMRWNTLVILFFDIRLNKC